MATIVYDFMTFFQSEKGNFPSMFLFQKLTMSKISLEEQCVLNLILAYQNPGVHIYYYIIHNIFILHKYKHKNKCPDKHVFLEAVIYYHMSF